LKSQLEQWKVTFILRLAVQTSCWFIWLEGWTFMLYTLHKYRDVCSVIIFLTNIFHVDITSSIWIHLLPTNTTKTFILMSLRLGHNGYFKRYVHGQLHSVSIQAKSKNKQVANSNNIQIPNQWKMKQCVHVWAGCTVGWMLNCPVSTKCS